MKLELQKRIRKVVLSLKDCPNSRKKHYTFIVLRSKIISVGWNNGWKTHPLAGKHGHRFNSTHSEIAALSNFQYPVSHLKHFEIVNVRLLNDSGYNLGMSKPCLNCEAMLIGLGVAGVWYSDRYGDFRYISY